MNETFKTTDKAKQLTGTVRKTCRLDTYLSATPRLLRSCWDGGSYSSYSVFNINTRQHSEPPTVGSAFDRSPKVEYVAAPGDVLITTGTFCGEPSYPCFSCMKADLEAVKRFLGIV